MQSQPVQVHPGYPGPLLQVLLSSTIEAENRQSRQKFCAIQDAMEDLQTPNA